MHTAFIYLSYFTTDGNEYQKKKKKKKKKKRKPQTKTKKKKKNQSHFITLKSVIWYNVITLKPGFYSAVFTDTPNAFNLL